jgi:D-lactate dehydrogenase (cytochrome)
MKDVAAAKITDPERIRAYLSDESAAFHGEASELFLPANEAELAEVVRVASESRTPLTISGGGTGITGSRVPVGGGAVVSVERMVSIDREPPDGFEALEGPGFSILLNKNAKTAIVPPAITLAALDAMLARHDLLYPPDPTEMSAMIGGTVATNASGARSFHYGPTRAWVRRLRVVLPTGDVAELRRGDPPAQNGVLSFEAGGRTVEVPLPGPADYAMPHTKNAAGLYLAAGMEPIDLFIGCEGLLGVVSEVEIGLVDRPPRSLTVIAYFNSHTDALDFVDAGQTEGRSLGFLSLEYFDARALDFMREKHSGIPQGVAAAVLFEVAYGQAGEHNPYPGGDMLSGLGALLERHRVAHNWAVPGSRREDVRLFRHLLPEAVNEYVRKRAGKLGTDMAVPHDRLRELMDAYETESAACGVRFLIFGHIGNDHVHVNYLPENEEELKRAKQAYTRLARTAVALGGTISAEHGVGKKTIVYEDGRVAPYLDVLYGPAGLEAIAAVKRALDPSGILNLGNMVPAEMLA